MRLLRGIGRQPWGRAGLSGILLWASFPPLDLGFLATVALAPWWAALLSRDRPTGLSSFLLGAAFFHLSLGWLTHVTVPGWIALCLYLGLYFLLLDLVSRPILRLGVPPILALPVLWTGLEHVRTVAFTGFPWLALGHAGWRMGLVRQAADLFGVAGVTFLFALTSAFAAEAAAAPPPGSPARARGPRRSLLAAAWLAALGYGALRPATLALEDGPRVAAIQENVPQSVALPPPAPGVLRRMCEETQRIRPGECDLVLWPETMVSMEAEAYGQRFVIQPPLDAPIAEHVLADIRTAAKRAGCPILAGAFGLSPAGASAPGKRPPHRNCAWLVRPDPAAPLERYDKIHLVPFGEYIPLRKTFPFLARLVPFDMTDLESGDQATRFLLGRWTFAAAICFEDTVAGVVRRLAAPDAAGRKIDFLANLSNDGWFGTSWELDDHLAASVFRAVEHRISIVRSVNTGATSAVDPLGRVERIRLADGSDRGAPGVLRARLSTCPSVTLYARIGDAFAWACVALSALALLLSAARRRTPPPAPS